MSDATTSDSGIERFPHKHIRPGLLDVQEINVPRSIAKDIHEFLRERGTLGIEAVGFWAGVREGNGFDVRAPIIPNQDAESSEHGLAVMIGSQALFDMNVLLHKNGWLLIAQIHSHPGRAYHSSTDDAYSVVTRVGGLSIVVPEFAAGSLDPRSWAVHRLDERARWQRVPAAQAQTLIRLVD